MFLIFVCLDACIKYPSICNFVFLLIFLNLDCNTRAYWCIPIYALFLFLVILLANEKNLWKSVFVFTFQWSGFNCVFALFLEQNREKYRAGDLY